jgi:hypothetical protein
MILAAEDECARTGQASHVKRSGSELRRRS